MGACCVGKGGFWFVWCCRRNDGVNDIEAGSRRDCCGAICTCGHRNIGAKSGGVVSEIVLCGFEVIAAKCIWYIKQWLTACPNFDSLSPEVCANLDQELLSVVYEMKKELGFDSL